jgi:hypothetical protein
VTGAPPPQLIANGFTDDLFPVDEAVRYYNLEQALFPGNPIALFDWDGGHQRGQNKLADNALLSSRIQSFFDHYVKDAGTPATLGATALTQTCPASAPSGGPYWAPTWAALHPHHFVYRSASDQTILSSAGNLAVAQKIDPITGPGACATAPAIDQGPGVATYRLPARPEQPERPADLPATSRGLALRRRAHPEAGAPRAGPALREDLQRTVLHRRGEPGAAGSPALALTRDHNGPTTRLAR